MIVIVDNVTAKNEGGDEVIVKTAKGIERDIKDLLRCSCFQKKLLRDDSSLIAIIPQRSDDNPRGVGRNYRAGSMEECII